jgi:hypothetical protein
MQSKERKKSLIISAVGNKSLHRIWFKGAKPKFDLMLIYFGNEKDKYINDAKYYIALRGMFKLENIEYAIRKFEHVVRNYDAIWLPDDDMSINARSINKLFDVFYRYNLDLAQPTLTSGRSYAITAPNPKYLLRFVNYVEIGCPIFKTDLLFQTLRFFRISRSGWGAGYLWSKYSQEHNRRMAMIDCVSLMHRLDIERGLYYKKLESAGINACHELESLAKIHGFKIGAHEEFEGIRSSLVHRLLYTIKLLLCWIKVKAIAARDKAKNYIKNR